MAVMPPAVVMPATSAPAVMVAAAATGHVSMAVAMSLYLDHAVILSGKRCHAKPCGCGRCDGEKRRDRDDGNEREAFHGFLQIAGWRLVDTISRSMNCSIDATGHGAQTENSKSVCRSIPLAKATSVPKIAGGSRTSRDWAARSWVSRSWRSVPTGRARP